MDSILIILKKKMAHTGTIFFNIHIYSRSQVSVYRTIGPLVLILFVMKCLNFVLLFGKICPQGFRKHLIETSHEKMARRAWWPSG